MVPLVGCAQVRNGVVEVSRNTKVEEEGGHGGCAVVWQPAIRWVRGGGCCVCV